MEDKHTCTECGKQFTVVAYTSTSSNYIEIGAHDPNHNIKVQVSPRRIWIECKEPNDDHTVR